MADENNNVIAFTPRPKSDTGSGPATAVAERPKAPAHQKPAAQAKAAAKPAAKPAKAAAPKHSAAKPTKREASKDGVRTVRANDKIDLRSGSAHKPVATHKPAAPKASEKSADSKQHKLHVPHFLKKDDDSSKEAPSVRSEAVEEREEAESGAEKSKKPGFLLPEFKIPEIHIEPPTPEQLRKMGIVAAIVLVVLGFLYVPARSLYVARRDEAVLTARLETLEDENADLQHSIETLQTREGIEDEARRRGYIVNGETSVNVQGLEGAEGEQQGVDIATLTANGAVEEGDLPWYVVLGDFVFQYQPTF